MTPIEDTIGGTVCAIYSTQGAIGNRAQPVVAHATFRADVGCAFGFARDDPHFKGLWWRCLSVFERF